MLTANSAAILTDAFPADQRGLALGTNQIAAIAGQFIGLVAGGAARRDRLARRVLGQRAGRRVRHGVGVPQAARDRRAPSAAASTGGATSRSRSASSAILIGVTYGIQPYGGHAMGWTNPTVLGRRSSAASALLVGLRASSSAGSPSRCSSSACSAIRAFAAGNAAGLIAAVARGGLQFMLIIWLQGIWLPLHGYGYAETPLWAGIYLLPLTAGVPDLGTGLRATCPTASARAASPPPACCCSPRASSG